MRPAHPGPLSSGSATNYPPSASCRPSTAPPAVYLLHRSTVHGLPHLARTAGPVSVIPAKAGIHVPPLLRGDSQGGYAPATCVAYSQTPTRRKVPPHHPSSAFCHPSTAPPAVLLHRVYGLLATAPIARTPHCTGRGHIPSPGACSGRGRGRGPPTAPLSPREMAGVMGRPANRLDAPSLAGKGPGVRFALLPLSAWGRGARGVRPRLTAGSAAGAGCGCGE